MIVKLSDFILEQTVSNADVIDISMEQAKAEIDVYSALLDVYCKNINRGFVMEESTETFGDKIKRFFISIGNWFRKMWIKFLAYFSEKRLKRIIDKLSGMSSTEKSSFIGYLPFNTEGYVEKLKTFINISDKFSKMINTDVMNPDFEYNAEELKADLKKYKSLMKEAKSSKDSYSYNYKDYKDFMDELYSTYNESKTTLESIKKNFNPKNNDSNQNIDDARAKKLYGVVNRLYNSYSSEASAQITIIMRMINNAEKNKANAKAGYNGAADTLHMTEKYNEIVQKFNSLNGKAQNEFKERLSKCNDKINKHDMAGSFKENQPLAKEVMSELTALEKDIDEYIKNEPIKKKQKDDEDKSTIEALIKEAKELIKKLEEDEKTIVKRADSLHDSDRYQAQIKPSYDIERLKKRLEDYVSDYETGKFDDKSINISFLKSVITDAKRIDSDIISVKQNQTPDAYKKEYEKKLDNLIKTISTAIDAFVKKGYMTHETGKYVKDTISTKSSGAREYETAISYVTKVTDKWDVFNKGGHLAVFIGKAMPLIFVYYKENALLTSLDRNFSYGQPLGIPEKSKIHCSDATAEDFESNIRLIQREDSNIRQETKEFNEKSKDADEKFRKNHESFKPEEVLGGVNGSEKDKSDKTNDQESSKSPKASKDKIDGYKIEVFKIPEKLVAGLELLKKNGLLDEIVNEKSSSGSTYDLFKKAAKDTSILTERLLNSITTFLGRVDYGDDADFERLCDALRLGFMTVFCGNTNRIFISNELTESDGGKAYNKEIDFTTATDSDISKGLSTIADIKTTITSAVSKKRSSGKDDKSDTNQDSKNAKKNQTYTPDDATKQSVDALKTAKWEVLRRVGLFIDVIRNRYFNFRTKENYPEAFINANIGDKNSSSLKELASNFRSYAKSDPDKLDKRIINNINQVADITEKMAELISPDGISKNVISDMKKYANEMDTIIQNTRAILEEISNKIKNELKEVYNKAVKLNIEISMKNEDSGLIDEFDELPKLNSVLHERDVAAVKQKYEDWIKRAEESLKQQKASSDESKKSE